MIVVNEPDGIVSKDGSHTLRVEGFRGDKGLFVDFIVAGHCNAALCDRADAEAIRDWLIEYLQ